jgi:hypothetical protein
MKKAAITVFVIMIALQLGAATLYDQLCAFNPNWLKYADRAPQGPARFFPSDRELIQTHLENVIRILRNNSTSGLTPAQLSSRSTLIEELDAYRVAGRFPQNHYRFDRIPVFIDEHGTHCAVGHLMRCNGHEDLALRTAAKDNYIWVKDITDPDVVKWQIESGFTMEELKLIQGAYDSYIPFAWTLPNKIEIPQKPEVVTRYFENENTGKPMKAEPANIWVKGEGKNGVLHGKWIQYFSKGLPWIIGYFKDGERSGQWSEYYQGTSQLCRTENWRNDKLNGIRKRWDRQGRLIEEILFKDGKAVTKTNYSLEDSLTYIRKPLDSNLVYTEIFNYEGSMIACGQERIYNPGNLQWFQNIELTALNTMMLPQSQPITSIATGNPFRGSYTESSSYSGAQRVELYGNISLVQYKKEGTWTYYREYTNSNSSEEFHMFGFIQKNYRHLANTIISSLVQFRLKIRYVNCDSIRMGYVYDQPVDFYAYSTYDHLHLQAEYYDSVPEIHTVSLYYWSNYGHDVSQQPAKVMKTVGELDYEGKRVGEWNCFDQYGRMYKSENYLIAWKEEE